MLKAFLTPENIIAIFIFIGGYIVSLFIHSLKVANELKYIKGQLSILVGFMNELNHVKEDVSNLRTAVAKNSYDIDRAHDVIRNFKPYSTR